MSNYIKITLTLIGALVGAGFASGEEIYLFFYSYGVKGIKGIIISSMILGIIIYKTLKIIKEEEIKNYKQYLEYLIPNMKNQKIRKKLIEIINNVTNIFILLTFYIMLAGFGSYLKEKFEIPMILGSSILAIICTKILSKKSKAIIKINEIIVPILIIFILIIGITNLKEIKIENLRRQIHIKSENNWVIGATLYATYNSILLIPTIISIKETIRKKEIKKISISITISILILILSIYIRNK